MNVVEHHYTYGVHQGVWKEEHHHDDEHEEGREGHDEEDHDEHDHDEERHGYRTHSVRHGYCYLDSDMMSTPSAEIINRVISEGPVEVITEQIKTSDNNGEVSISATPTLPGIYLTIAQSRITRNGATMTGI